MVLIACFAFSVLSVPLTGGRLAALGDVRFRHAWALLGALGLQVLIIYVLPTGPAAVHGAAHVGSFLLGGVAVAANRRLPGLWLIAAGGGLNLAAISANGGVMPASSGAVRLAGLEHAAAQFHNSAMVEDAKLAFLGDVFAIPASWPLANVFSVGDVALVVGGAVALHALSGSGLWLRAATAASRLRTLVVLAPAASQPVGPTAAPAAALAAASPPLLAAAAGPVVRGG